jgi:ubiquitin carboxyl-terminal hydrolase 5/13
MMLVSPPLLVQVGVALCEGRTGRAAAAASSDGCDTSVRPASFKSLVGRGHPEFSSARQQDAAEFWVHLLELVRSCWV